VRIIIEPESGEGGEREVYIDVNEFALVGTMNQKGQARQIQRSHLRCLTEPFDLIGTLEAVKARLICNVRRLDKN
jgi:hypothetical protein